mmetsp:Transcript_9830/g.16056  ORF Transcript_9830/g.16056 Transcript_9830/m.16056 type:complete len:324 (+) Transcript_9830:55-1026(+)
MQYRVVLALAVLLAPASTASVKASAAAEAWLKAHQAPNQDQLGELAQANPQVFAIVSALLNKHKSTVTLSADEKGPDVFRKMMTPRHLSVSAPSVAQPYPVASQQPYPNAELAEVQPPVIDEAHYDARQASDKDGSMVDKILEMAASMGGDRAKKIALLRKKHKFSKQQAEDPFAKDKELFAEDIPATPAPIQASVQSTPVEEQSAVAPTRKENSYLKGIDLSGDMPKVMKKSTKQENSYLKGIDVNGALAAEAPSSLSTFSFDDVAPTTVAPKKVVAPEPKKENAFLKWLGVVNKAPAPTEAPVAQEKPVVKQNSYLAQFMS